MVEVVVPEEQVVLVVCPVMYSTPFVRFKLVQEALEVAVVTAATAPSRAGRAATAAAMAAGREETGLGQAGHSPRRSPPLSGGQSCSS